MTGINERVARLEVRFENLKEDVRNTRSEIKAATREVRALADEMRKVTVELRSAVASVAANAARPFENLSWGWRVLAGIGGVVLSVATLVGGVLGIFAYFRPHP